MVGSFFALSRLDLAPWQKVDLVTLDGCVLYLARNLHSLCAFLIKSPVLHEV